MNNKNTFKIILIALLIAIAGGFIWYQSTKNNLITLNESIESSWAQVENQMQRRYDLIPNLVNTVKGYATHEKGVFESIAAARSKLIGAKTVDEKISANRGFESALSRLLVITENYPNLKADTQFNRLMDELAGAENRLSVERRRYNENILVFNRTVQMFPGNIVANFAGFHKKSYFEAEEQSKTTPKVSF